MIILYLAAGLVCILANIVTWGRFERKHPHWPEAVFAITAGLGYALYWICVAMAVVALFFMLTYKAFSP